MTPGKLYTLRTLLEEHPEWGDLPIGVLRPDGETDYVNWAGGCWASDPHPDNKEATGSDVVLIFAHN